MGSGAPPGPAGQKREHVDAGTLATIGSPPPGPVGLAAPAGVPSRTTAKANAPGAADQIVAYIRRRIGERVGNGECFTVVDRALRAAGTRSASDFGQITPNADYVWGQAETLAAVQPGDVIQFRNYRYDREVVERTERRVHTSTDFQTRPHHTAIVESVDGNGAITVLEQNVPVRSAVRRTQLFFADSTTTSGGTTTTIHVQGTFTFYRPQVP